MRFIEHYPDYEDQVAEIDGRSFPLPCLVEDEDGIRLLLTYASDDGEVRVPVRTWTAAHTSGAAALVDAFSCCWMSAETFMAHRVEHHAAVAYLAPARWSGPEDHIPSYRQMVEWTHEAEEVAADLNGQDAASPFVHLHAHSEYSPLDGLSMVSEMVEAVVADHQVALAVTDHGMCAAHPALQKAADAAGIRPIFGIEANFTEDRRLRGDESVKDIPEHRLNARRLLNDYQHLVLWALDDVGLRNLWGASTEANRTGFYGRPRMDWEVLETFAEGVACGTGCLRGPLAAPLLAGDDVTARMILARLMEIFPGRLYVEIHTNHLPENLRLNEALVALAAEFDLPIVASVDAH